MNKLRKKNNFFSHRNKGAATIEMAISLPVFLLVLLGMIEFSLLLFEFGKGVDVTRHTLRQAVVSDSLQDLSSLNGCDHVDEFGNVTASIQVPDCSDGVSFCNGYANNMLRFFQASDLNVVYGCSGAGYIERATSSVDLLIPEVRVNLDVTYTFLFSQILGLGGDDGLSISKTFTATRTGEDMDTVL